MTASERIREARTLEQANASIAASAMRKRHYAAGCAEFGCSRQVFNGETLCPDHRPQA